MSETENEIIPTCITLVIISIIFFAILGYSNILIIVIGLVLIALAFILLFTLLYRFFRYYLNVCFACIENEVSDSEEESVPSSDSDEEYIEDDNIIIVPKEQITLITANL
jgi:hypothetical protein